jgi:hypothetical protein
MQKAARKLFLIAAIDIILIAMGVAGSAILRFMAPNLPHRAPLSFSVAAVAVVTFFGLLQLQQASSLEPGDMRKPIAGTVTVVYLVLVATFSFFFVPGQLPPLTETFINSFTTIMGVVVAFYFGSSAYIEASSRRAGHSRNDGPRDDSA